MITFFCLFAITLIAAHQRSRAAKADLAKLRSQYDDLADAYRDALATIKELKVEVDHEPEYC